MVRPSRDFGKREKFAAAQALYTSLRNEFAVAQDDGGR
jgi:hypothetical protein